jgi:hypothetical protein
MKINCQWQKQGHTLLLLEGLDSVSLRVGSGRRCARDVWHHCWHAAANSKP